MISSFRTGTAEQPLRMALSKEESEKMLKESTLKASAELPLQFVSDRNTVTANGREYSLDTLSEYSVRAPGFVVTIDDEEASVSPRSPLWRGTNNGASIFLLKDERGDSSFIHIQDEESETMLVSAGSAMGKRRSGMVAVKPDDYDYKGPQ
jgi:hypothetical protein